jgi:N-acetylglutamate synthase-like GNAT family acetyltransferase
LAEFLIRLSTASDFPAIKALIRETHLNPLGLDWRRFIVVTRTDGVFAGCGQIKPHNDGSRELASIAVIAEYRGQGVARKVIEQLLATNPPPLYLMCRSSLEPFYLKFGFRSLEYFEMPSYFQRMVRLSGLMLHMAQSNDHLSVMKIE